MDCLIVALIYWRTILFADGFLMNQKAYSEMFRASCSRVFFFCVSLIQGSSAQSWWISFWSGSTYRASYLAHFWGVPSLSDYSVVPSLYGFTTDPLHLNPKFAESTMAGQLVLYFLLRLTLWQYEKFFYTNGWILMHHACIILATSLCF